MNIAFRVDASIDIGTGHTMRCLNLASALREAGAKCVFISKNCPGDFNLQIEQQGYEVFKLNERDEVRSFDLIEDAKTTKALIKNHQIDWLIIDHYKIDKRWQNILRDCCQKILVIDDLADRPHECDLLLDGNVSRSGSDYTGFVPEGCDLLIGPEYLLLDPICHKLKTKKREGTLVFLGGGDNQTDLERLIPIVAEGEVPKPVTIILGQSQPNKEKLQSQCKHHKIGCEINPENFKERCSQAELALVRCGLVSYELATFLTPSISFWREGIHKKVALWLEEKNYCFATTIEEFTSKGSIKSQVSQALKNKPNKALQTNPGQLRVIEHMNRAINE